MILRVDGDPRPQVRPRVFSRGGRMMAWSPKSEWANTVQKLAYLARPKAPFNDAVRVTMDFQFQKARTRKDAGMWVTKRPDVDNLSKVIYDSLTKAQWWTDDCLVVHSTALKRYCRPGEVAGVSVIVEPIE